MDWSRARPVGAMGEAERRESQGALARLCEFPGPGVNDVPVGPKPSASSGRNKRGEASETARSGRMPRLCEIPGRIPAKPNARERSLQRNSSACLVIVDTQLGVSLFSIRRAQLSWVPSAKCASTWLGEPASAASGGSRAAGERPGAYIETPSWISFLFVSSQRPTHPGHFG